jgi:plasmid stabilization system protein ParE
MTLDCLIRPEAEADIAAAKQWYNQRQAGLGDRFLVCVDEALQRIRREPLWRGLIHKDLRRALVQHFPYGVFYKVTEKQIIVVGVIHARRRSAVWKKRD